MKIFYTFLVLTAFYIQGISQTSPLSPVCTFNYQAVIRGGDDVVINNSAVTVQFTILDGPGGNELYIEQHATSTSSLGLVNLEVGAGNVIGGSMVFNAIPWVIRKHFLRVDIDLDGSGNFINIGEAPVLAVPIAIQAKVASFAVSTLDTIKMIDTLRVDTLRVAKLFADDLCADTIIVTHVIVDTLDALKIYTDDLCADSILSDLIYGEKIFLDSGSICITQEINIGDNIIIDYVTGGFHVNDAAVFGSQTTPDGTAGLFEGDVNINGGELEMKNFAGDVVFSVDEKGNSYHKGEEVFEGGIVLINPQNNETVVFLDAGASGLTGYAMTVNGNFMLNGVLQAEVKQFVIDHPLNPDEMTLRHYSVESDQMGTVYNGTVSFDENGEAWVELPTWFEALNTDFSYQLTCVGGFSNVYIAEEVKNNRFKIAGGNKDLKVSWQVNGVRHDPVSSSHLRPIEEYKNSKLE